MLNQWTCICSVHPEWRPWNLIVRSERFQTITENFHRERRKTTNGNNRIELESDANNGVSQIQWPSKIKSW
jgi:hypothetical protein